MKALFALVVVIAALGTAGAASADPFITDTLAPGGPTGGHVWGSTSGTPSPPFITDTLAPGGGPAVVAGAPSSSFRWSDAGVGAAAAAGSILVVLGSTLLVIRRRTRFAI